ncbi:hypothetical protein TIFTF001_024495 [Ficus carica]|uniref:Uncharacterized protein n=1 Tax=Ficus carica TaxID=3494 RepID=A0AA88DKD7_FICCA|nr:hypothetical protein TIFTF001_024495 [Ficus carica]
MMGKNQSFNDLLSSHNFIAFRLSGLRFPRFNISSKNLNHKNARARTHTTTATAALPIRHGSDGLEGEYQSPIRIGAAILPPTERRRQELAGGAVGLGDHGGETSVGEERIRRTTDTDGVVVAGFVSEGPPLGGLVDGVRLEHEAALGADGVPRRVVEDDLRLPLAIGAESVRHCGGNFSDPRVFGWRENEGIGKGWGVASRLSLDVRLGGF